MAVVVENVVELDFALTLASKFPRWLQSNSHVPMT